MQNTRIILVENEHWTSQKIELSVLRRFHHFLVIGMSQWVLQRNKFPCNMVHDSLFFGTAKQTKFDGKSISLKISRGNIGFLISVNKKKSKWKYSNAFPPGLAFFLDCSCSDSNAVYQVP